MMNNNQNQETMAAEVHRSLIFKAAACAAEMEEMEQDSAGSSEEVESPRSVGRWRRRTKKLGCVHSQILRIREEDSLLGESTAAFGAKDHHHQHQQIANAVASGVDVVIFSRPMLPSSPLKNTVNALH